MRRVAVVVALLMLGGCASAEARRLATELRKQTEVNRAASQPKAGVDPVKWSTGQDEAGRAARNLEKELE